MKIRIKSTLRPVLVTVGAKYNRIAGGTILEVNGKPWPHQYVAVSKQLTLNDIEWVSPSIPRKAKPQVQKVQGSKGNVYTVTTFGNGSKTCTCPGFQYRRFCKHTGAK